MYLFLWKGYKAGAQVKSISPDLGSSLSFPDFQFLTSLGFILLNFADFFTVNPNNRLTYDLMVLFQDGKKWDKGRDSRKEEREKSLMIYWGCPAVPPPIFLFHFPLNCCKSNPWNPKQPGSFSVYETRAKKRKVGRTLKGKLWNLTMGSIGKNRTFLMRNLEHLNEWIWDPN